MSAWRGSGALGAGPPSAGVIARAADVHRKSRRVIVMSWFPELLKTGEGQENV
jgi:hypothetical protein